MRARRSRGPGRPVVVAVVVAGVLLIAYSVLVRFTHDADPQLGVQPSASSTTAPALRPPVAPVVVSSPTPTPTREPTVRPTPSRSGASAPTPSPAAVTVTATATTTATRTPVQFRQALSDFAPIKSVNGSGPYEINRSNGDDDAGDGLPMTIKGTSFPHGLGVHSNSDLVFALRRPYTGFTTAIGIDDVGDPGTRTGTRGSAIFRVYIDGVMRYESPVMHGQDPPRYLKFDLTGARELRLVVDKADSSTHWDFGDWAIPDLVGVVGG